MKKNLFLSAIVLCATALFTACNPSGQTTKLTGLTVKPESITLSTGENVRLAALTTPENIQVNIEWATSDPAVATVNELGVVTAAGMGQATITAKSGEFTGTCRVTVTSYLETLQFTQAIVWDSEQINDEVYTIQAIGGAEYQCYIVNATYRLFSAGLYVDAQGYINGASEGAIVDLVAPMFYAPADLNGTDRNTAFSLGEWAVAETEDSDIQKNIQIGKPGALNDSYLTNLLAFVDKFNATDETWVDNVKDAQANGYTGVNLFLMYYDCDDPADETSCGYSFANNWGAKLPNALVTKGYIYADGVAQGSSDYMTVLDYSSITMRELAGGWGGLDADVDEETETIILNSENLLLGNEFTVEQGTRPAEVKGTMMPVPFVMTKDYPEVAKRIDAQLQNFKKLQIKK